MGIAEETKCFPVGTYVKTDKYDHIMMAMKTTLDKDGANN